MTVRCESATARQSHKRAPKVHLSTLTHPRTGERENIGLLRLFTSCIPSRSAPRSPPSEKQHQPTSEKSPHMNGAQPARRPPPTGPAPPAPAVAPPAPPNAVAAQPSAAQAPPTASRQPNGPVNGTHAHSQKGKKKSEPPVDPSQLYESLKNRIATLEEEEIHNEEEERRIGVCPC